MYINQKMIRDLKDSINKKVFKDLNIETTNLNLIRERQESMKQIHLGLDQLVKLKEKLQ